MPTSGQHRGAPWRASEVNCGTRGRIRRSSIALSLVEHGRAQTAARAPARAEQSPESTWRPDPLGRLFHAWSLPPDAPSEILHLIAFITCHRSDTGRRYPGNGSEAMADRGPLDLGDRLFPSVASVERPHGPRHGGRHHRDAASDVHASPRRSNPGPSSASPRKILIGTAPTYRAAGPTAGDLAHESQTDRQTAPHVPSRQR
jgi:hypothetical protein